MMEHFGISLFVGTVYPKLIHLQLTNVSIDGLMNFCNTYNYIGGVQFPSHELCSCELSCAWFVLVACKLTCGWLFPRRLHWIFLLKIWCSTYRFSSNMTADSSRHLDDDVLALFFFTFEYMVILGFHCIRVGLNFFPS